MDKPVSLSYEREMFDNYVSPGEAFDSSRQCSLVFGAGSQICPYMVRTLVSHSAKRCLVNSESVDLFSSFSFSEHRPNSLIPVCPQ